MSTLDSLSGAANGVAPTSRKPLLVTIPHSGERVPPETPWLSSLPERLLMFDVDRYVDRLYAKAIASLGLRCVATEWHRYAADLNRFADDVDADSVVGAEHPSGAFPRGLHWSITTAGERLMPAPMPKETHDRIVKLYFDPFHEQTKAALDAIRKRGAKQTYHVDLHSMPSIGTREHRDPGERRADVVVSDCDGRSCSREFKDAVIASYEKAGFKVAYNWPYKGGRITEAYGAPAAGQHAIQAELNRSLYMDETEKKLNSERLAPMQEALGRALRAIHDSLPDIG